MPTIDPKKFVSQLELAPVEIAMDRDLTVSGLQEMTDNEEEAYVNQKSLVSFVSSVSGQNRKDVLNSTLLAQRAADKKYPDPADVRKWYDMYIDVLTQIGWVVEEKNFADFDSSNAIFEMENVVIDILATLVGQNYIAIIKSTLDAVKSLSEGDGRIKIFESNSHNFKKGNFQIGLVNETNGAVSMNLGAFMLESQDGIKKILFFKSGKDKSALSYYSIRCTLNDDMYSLVRKDILKKLGPATSAFIGRLDI
jgi:hypothetical protein